MRTLEKAIRTAQIEGKPWKQQLYTFLRNYRATPHSTTDTPPFDAMFQRPMKTKLPEVPSNVETAELKSNESQKTDDFAYEMRQQKTKLNRTLIDKDVPNHQRLRKEMLSWYEMKKEASCKHHFNEHHMR
jgi:hypothetical protein